MHPTRFAVVLALLSFPAHAFVIVDTTNAVITSTSITGILADGLRVSLSIGDAIPGYVYDPADYPETIDVNGLQNQLGLALVSEFNIRGVLPSLFSGCEPTLCAIFIPSAYNTTREFYSISNALWQPGLATWVPDEGDLRSTWTGAQNSSVTLAVTTTRSVPAAATLALLGLGLVGLSLHRKTE